MDTDARDREQLELILDLIGKIERRLGSAERESFLDDIDEVDLTAFRLAHIGEAAGRLSQSVKDRHPNLPWRAMMGMRNLISHTYGRINPIPIWTTATEDLSELSQICRSELAQLGE